MRSLATMLLLLVTAPLMAQVAVFNAAIPVEPFDAKRMAALLLGRISTWGDGSPVILVLAAERNADAHLAHVTGRERPVLERSWKRLVFAGAGAMPITARSSAEALLLVANTPGAVVLLDQAPADPRWRVVPLVVTADH
ncbi:MAG TPA: hypothetical protein VHX44_19860 [Planctomycetota bacterium]|jgi:hypothetical protein|nr:hypothetical protein [Planctomycetota bacterium]